MKEVSSTEINNCGQWRIVREIGRGAYGVVYFAVGHQGEFAAVKVCSRESLDQASYERELRGAKLYKTIPPCGELVRMHELVEGSRGFYTVMDLADDEFGGNVAESSPYRPKTLARVIDGERALSLKDSVELAIVLAEGLVTLQRHHFLHRDIKPGNVLYVNGRPVLSDPGLVVEESEASSLVGTPGYVPPEHFTNAGSDVYSLGFTLKAASFGRRVEDVDKGPAQEADTSASLFPAWWRILNKATDPTPEKRYQSAKALLRELYALHAWRCCGFSQKQCCKYGERVPWRGPIDKRIDEVSCRERNGDARDRDRHCKWSICEGDSRSGHHCRHQKPQSSKSLFHAHNHITYDLLKKI